VKSGESFQIRVNLGHSVKLSSGEKKGDRSTKNQDLNMERLKNVQELAKCMYLASRSLKKATSGKGCLFAALWGYGHKTCLRRGGLTKFSERKRL